MFPWQVLLAAHNSIGRLLGVNNGDDFAGPDEWISPKIVNILSVNNMLVQCDIISGSSKMEKSKACVFFHLLRKNVKVGKSPPPSHNVKK